MIAKVLTASLLSVTCAISVARAQEPDKPLPDLPADVFAPPPARIAEARTKRDASRERFAKAKDRLLGLLAKWNAGIIAPIEAGHEIVAIAREVSEAAKLHGESDELRGAIKADLPSRPGLKRTWTLIDPLPEDPVLTWIIAQDGTALPKASIAQGTDAGTKVAGRVRGARPIQAYRADGGPERLREARRRYP